MCVGGHWTTVWEPDVFFCPRCEQQLRQGQEVYATDRGYYCDRDCAEQEEGLEYGWADYASCQFDDYFADYPD